MLNLTARSGMVLQHLFQRRRLAFDPPQWIDTSSLPIRALEPSRAAKLKVGDCCTSSERISAFAQVNLGGMLEDKTLAPWGQGHS
jgi:hypothetical protein